MSRCPACLLKRMAAPPRPTQHCAQKRHTRFRRRVDTEIPLSAGLTDYLNNWTRPQTRALRVATIVAARSNTEVTRSRPNKNEWLECRLPAGGKGLSTLAWFQAMNGDLQKPFGDNEFESIRFCDDQPVRRRRRDRSLRLAIQNACRRCRKNVIVVLRGKIQNCGHSRKTARRHQRDPFGRNREYSIAQPPRWLYAEEEEIIGDWKVTTAKGNRIVPDHVGGEGNARPRGGGGTASNGGEYK